MTSATLEASIESGLFMNPNDYLDCRDPAWAAAEVAGKILYVPKAGREPAEVRIHDLEIIREVRAKRGW